MKGYLLGALAFLIVAGCTAAQRRDAGKALTWGGAIAETFGGPVGTVAGEIMKIVGYSLMGGGTVELHHRRKARKAAAKSPAPAGG